MADTLTVDEKTNIPSALFVGSLQLNLFLAAHFVIGMVFLALPNLSTVHAYAVVALGVVWAVSKPPIYAGYVASYIVGSEVLWRMSDASFFWEGGKYSVILIFLLSIFHQRKKMIPPLPFFYFFFLLPSIILTIDARGLGDARDAISFNLSGPLALFISAWFFSGMVINRSQLVNLISLLVAPLISIATFALLNTIRAEEIQWVTESMFETSGGFGPNQVSTVVGLGMFAIWILLIIQNSDTLTKIFHTGIGIIFIAQGLLTFSRGGVLTAIIVVIFLSLHIIRNQKERLRLNLFLFILAPTLLFVVLPLLNNFTEGFLGLRFAETTLTNREILMEEELQLFFANPIGGIGPGGGNDARRGASHTEYTRLLAEHGMLGVISMILLALISIRRYLGAKGLLLKGLTGSFMLWSLLIMSNAAMRLVALSFVFGLAFAKLELDE